MGKRTKLGILTPSSNTVLEPVTSGMVETLPDVSAHFGRFPVVEISLTEPALDQFRFAPMLEASRLLADGKTDVIGWSGTSAGWLGFDMDRQLCAEIEASTGILATSSVLALDEIFRKCGVKRFGLVTPYLDDVQEMVIKNFAVEGFECATEVHLGDKGNYSL